MKINRFIKAIVFVLVFSVCFFSIQALLSGDLDTRNRRRVTGFFAERENSLDAVFLGSSATYTFWNPAQGWNEYGITVYPFATAQQEILATKFLIDDARKKHPDAIYIVNLTSVTEFYNFRIHGLIDGYPNTINKFRMIDYLCDMGGLSFSERMEYYFPIIRFHDRWNELSHFDFEPPEERYKSSNYYNSFLNTTRMLKGDLWDYDEKAPLTETLEKGFTELMDYCEEENVKVLFILSPQATIDEEKRGKQNALMEMANQRGFDTLDMNKYAKEMKLDRKTDYFDREHTNLHGSIKVTDFLSKYLVENYNLKDKRGDEEFSDWTEECESYYSYISKKFSQTDLEYISIKEE